MKFNTFISSTADLKACLNSKQIDEVLIETDIFAREGRISSKEAKILAEEARSNGLKTVLVWDVLMTESDFSDCALNLEKIGVSTFSAVRVQSIGAASYLKNKFPEIKIQYIAENASCNLTNLRLLISLFSPQLERLILSIQLPAEKISEYVKSLPIKCEILGAGRILLFYSRRKLLEKEFSNLGETWREVIAESTESGNRPFSIIDNQHGTFMYLDKDQFILHRLAALGDGVPEYLRIDIKHLSEFPDSARDIERISNLARSTPEILKNSWPRGTIAPFFKSNLTTKQFKFLNSELRFSRDKDCVAEVLSTDRKKLSVLRMLQSIVLPANFRAIDPSGHEATFEIPSLKTLDGKLIQAAEVDQIVIAPAVKKISSGSLVLRTSQ